jgi:transcriptional regulator with XRE-family HTH domain
MANPAEAGRRIRMLREDNGWTLADLTDKTGISKSTLSKLENGQTNLSLTNLIKLSEGLQIPITTLTNPSLPRTGARRSMTVLAGGNKIESRDGLYEILCNDLAGQDQIFMRVNLTNRSMSPTGGFHSHPGQEFILVLEGTLVLCTEAYEPSVLETGDSIMFDSSMGHHYVATGEGETVILVVMQRAGYTAIEDQLEDLNG